jgi:hypothetical protein
MVLWNTASSCGIRCSDPRNALPDADSRVASAYFSVAGAQPRRPLAAAAGEQPEDEVDPATLHGCHTLKHLILGCDYLLQCVHLSIRFFKNFKDFSGNYSIYPRARSIFFYLESSKILFHVSQIFYLESS